VGRLPTGGLFQRPWGVWGVGTHTPLEERRKPVGSQLEAAHCTVSLVGLVVGAGPGVSFLRYFDGGPTVSMWMRLALSSLDMARVSPAFETLSASVSRSKTPGA
jgi:hypothetical protein